MTFISKTETCSSFRRGVLSCINCNFKVLLNSLIDKYTNEFAVEMKRCAHDTMSC